MHERRLIDDCFLTDKERLRHDEALAILRERIGPVVEAETVPLASASGRILAETIASPRNVPADDNAAVDGYAYAHADYEAAGGFFPVAARIAAGHASPSPHLPGTAARIFTGAVMPVGADTVAMQEDCEAHVQDGRDFVAIPPGLKRGANRRKAGEDLAGGRNRRRARRAAQAAGDRRHRIDGPRPAFPSSAAFAWRSSPPATRSSGRAPPSARARSTIPTISCSPRFCGRSIARPWMRASCPIPPRRCASALLALAETSDAVLTTGGASRGEEDHLVASLDAVGKRHLWQLAVKPGRPMSFGQVGDCPVVALPGNPVAAFVCFLLYVRPMLTVMGGGAWPEPQRFEVGRRLRDRRAQDAAGASSCAAGSSATAPASGWRNSPATARASSRRCARRTG